MTRRRRARLYRCTAMHGKLLPAATAALAGAAHQGFHSSVSTTPAAIPQCACSARLVSTTNCRITSGSPEATVRFSKPPNNEPASGSHIFHVSILATSRYQRPPRSKERARVMTSSSAKWSSDVWAARYPTMAVHAGQKTTLPPITTDAGSRPTGVETRIAPFCRADTVDA